MPFDPTDLIGPGTIKGVLKGLDSMGIPCKGGIEILDEITNSHAYMKHRVDSFNDTVQDFWDDHKEDVSEFFDNVGDTISEGWDTITDNAGDILEGAADFFGSLFG